MLLTPEMQAWDRCHRIGQTKPVTIHRLAVAETVEQRILELQAKKKALADGAMGEGTGAKLGRLSVRDLIGLFGMNNAQWDN
jgi:SNF2 family DNA or RNA helicase